MCLYELITRIPDIVWSGLIASILTLSGVLLSNWSNTGRLKLQLNHDSQEKSKQRKSDLRRDVYLKVAEEIVKVNMYLPSIPQLDFAKVNVSDAMRDFFSAATKLQMVAEVQTSLQVIKLLSYYNELLLKVVAKSIPIQQLQKDIAIQTEHYDVVQLEIKRILEVMAHLNESGDSDRTSLGILTRSLEFQQDVASKVFAKKENLLAQYKIIHLEFLREFIPEMKIIGHLTVPLMVEIRRELDVGGEIDAFMIEMEDQWKKISVQLDVFLSGL